MLAELGTWLSMQANVRVKIVGSTSISATGRIVRSKVKRLLPSEVIYEVAIAFDPALKGLKSLHGSALESNSADAPTAELLAVS